MWWLVLLLAVGSGVLAPPVRADSIPDPELCALGASGRRDAAEAIDACNRALEPSFFGRVLGRGELSPEERAAIDVNLARIYARKRSYSQAIGYLNEAISLDPGNAHAYGLRAQLAAGRRDFRGAISDYSAAIQLAPSASAYLGRAQALQAQGQYASAKDDYQQALSRDPGNKEAREGLDLVMAGLRATQAADASSGGSGLSLEDFGRQLISPPADAAPPAATPTPPRQAEAGQPAPAAPNDGSPQLEGTEGRQQAIVSQVQQGLAALGYKLARTDGKLDEPTRQAMRKFAGQQKVKAPDVPDDDFLALVDQVREARGLAAGPPSGQPPGEEVSQAEPADPAKKDRVLRSQRALVTLKLLQATPNGKLGPATRKALGEAKVPFTNDDIDESVVAQLEDRAQLAQEQRAAQAAKEREKPVPPPAVVQKRPEPKESAPSAPPETKYAQLPDAVPETRKIPPTPSKDADTPTLQPVPAPAQSAPQAKGDTPQPSPPNSPLVIPDLTGDVDRVALVIGNGKYEYYGQLRNPPNDAADMRDFLERTGFRVFYGVDLSRDQMNTLTIAFHRAARKAQIAFAFYAGHGVQVDGTNYLIPTDVHIEDDADLRLLFELNDMIRDAAQAAKLGVVAVDACRDSPFIETAADTSGAGQTRSLNGLTAGFSAPQLQPHTLVVYATAATSTAEDGLGRNSPFTAALLKDLAEPEEVRFVFGKVVDDVAKATHGRQQPNKWDALGADKVFLVRPEAVAQALEAQLSPIERGAIQRSLVRLGLLARAEDGDTFGPNVHGAIRSFQAARNDPATGYLTVDEMVALHGDARSHGAPLPLPKFEFDDVQQRALADNPDPAAMRLMGMLYDRGYEASNSVPKRMSTAVLWYRKAATAGDIGAAIDLARILENGSDGVPPNATEAVRWLKMAATAGQADGQYELAKLVRDGNGVPKNPDEAVRLFRRAVASGSGEAAAELRAMKVPVEAQLSGR